MKKKQFSIRLLFVFVVVLHTNIVAQQDSLRIKKIIRSTSISGKFFLKYGYDDVSELNKFTFKRGYLTIKSKLNDVLSVRFTQDITQDKEGSDAGNIEMRLKYLYLKIKMKKYSALKNSYFEVGLTSRPWIKFEQSVNHYRVQGKMLLERNKIINSADFGLSYTCLFGGKMDKAYQQNVSSAFPGKYGSLLAGIYNGGGYHSIERNKNKTFEGQLSIRPFHKRFPGFQFGYSWALGKGNTKENPDFAMNVFYGIYETHLLSILTQYYTGKGDYLGRYVDDNNKSFDSNGFSAYFEIKIPNTQFALFGRYDKFTLKQTSNKENETLLGGISYYFLKKSKVIVDIEKNEQYGKTKNYYEIALEIAF